VSLVSPDALIQANAAMMVGIVFLVNLRKAREVSQGFWRDFRLSFVFFAISTTFVLLFDLTSVTISWFTAEIFFYLGLVTVSLMVWRMAR